MGCRTVLLGFVASMLAAGCHRADVSPMATETVAPVAAVPVIAPPKGDRLGKPVPVEVDGRPLVYDGGAGDPFVGDFDGDGRPDLLLGRGAEGRLLVYRNVGTETDPRLGGPQWFDDQVPTGRIPKR